MFLLYQVLKVAILAEKYASDYTWYVDTILHLIRIAGDHVSEEVSWYSLVYNILFKHVISVFLRFTFYARSTDILGSVPSDICVSLMVVQRVFGKNCPRKSSDLQVGTPQPLNRGCITLADDFLKALNT